MNTRKNLKMRRLQGLESAEMTDSNHLLNLLPPKQDKDSPATQFSAEFTEKLCWWFRNFQRIFRKR